MPTETPAPGTPAPDPDSCSAPLTVESVYEELRKCYDPELPLNIVDLGLVYDVQVLEGGKVHVKMTLTTPACCMGGTILQTVETRIKAMTGVTEAKAELVWDPPWNRDMISEKARKELGLA